MAYVKLVDYAAKDALLTGNPSKVIKGTELGAEFDSLATEDALNVKTTGTNTVASVTHAATSKTTPVDADEIPISDSAASWALKKLTWANLKATLINTVNSWTAQQKFTKSIETAKGANVASAATCDIWTPADGNFLHITGTVTITSFGTAPQAGAWRELKFDGALTLTHNVTTLVLPGAANITTAVGDSCIVYADTTANMHVVQYTKADGTTVIKELPTQTGNSGKMLKTDGSAVSWDGAGVLGTPTATTSGTAIDYTAIPSWVKRITITLQEVSLNAASDVLFQIGDSGGIEATGYVSGSCNGTTTAAYTAGFGLHNQVAASSLSGIVTLTLLNSTTNLWACSGNLWDPGASQVFYIAGSKSLSATLDRIRITTLGGTAIFDAGSVNILYE